MNQTQRSFLIKKIESTVDARIKALEADKPEYPSESNYIFNEAMKGTLKIRPIEELEEWVRQRALNAKSSDRDWLGDTDTSWGRLEKRVIMKYSEFFIIPEELEKLRTEYWSKRKEIDDKVAEIKNQKEALIFRIQLASDKTLQTMINEVDDMGNLSLMDTKLKLLTA